MKSVLAGLAVLVLAACNAPTDSTWSFRGRVQNLQQAPDETTAPTLAVIAPGVLSVLGHVTTPCWNDQVTLDGDRSGDHLTVEIESIPQQPCGDARVRTHSYSAIFYALNRATFTVTIINRIDNPAGVVVFEGTARIQ